MPPNHSSHAVQINELEFRMLGPLKVRANGRSLRLGGDWVRTVLARLLLDANRVVTSDQLVADLLGESRPSPTGMNTLMYAISRLRELLGPEVFVTWPDGYELRVDWRRTDIYRFERLALAGRKRLAADDPVEAAETLRLALNLWRGEPLDGVGVGPPGHVRRSRDSRSSGSPRPRIRSRPGSPSEIQQFSRSSNDSSPSTHGAGGCAGN